LRPAPVAVRAAPAGVQVARAVEVAKPGAAAARPAAAGRQAPGAVPRHHLRAGHAGDRLLDVVALGEQLRQPGPLLLLLADEAQDAGLRPLVAQDVLVALRDHRLLGLGVLAADLAGLLLGLLHLAFFGLLLFLLLGALAGRLLLLLDRRLQL